MKYILGISLVLLLSGCGDTPIGLCKDNGYSGILIGNAGDTPFMGDTCSNGDITVDGSYYFSDDGRLSVYSYTFVPVSLYKGSKK